MKNVDRFDGVVFSWEPSMTKRLVAATEEPKDRKVEAWRDRGWKRISFHDIKNGDVFCLFDLDDEEKLLGTFFARCDAHDGVLRADAIVPNATTLRITKS